MTEKKRFVVRQYVIEEDLYEVTASSKEEAVVKHYNGESIFIATGDKDYPNQHVAEDIGIPLDELCPDEAAKKYFSDQGYGHIVSSGIVYGIAGVEESHQSYLSQLVSVVAPAHWASFLFNGDASIWTYSPDPDDEAACLAMEKKYGSPVHAEDMGFFANPDYGKPGICNAYYFLPKERS